MPGGPLLGARVPPGPLAELVDGAGVDVVVLDLRERRLTVEALARAVRSADVPVLVWLAGTSTEAEAAAARRAGAAGVVVPDRDGADVVVTDGEPGRVVLVDDPESARAALGGDAALVVYDLPAMVGGLIGSLAIGRADRDSPHGRETLVLLPGMLGDVTVWDGLAAELADVVVPVPLRIDLDDTVEEMAAGVLAEAPPRFALCGHSLGGIVALEVVRQAPERITRLVLVNTSGRAPSTAQHATWARWRERTTAGGFAAVASELARATLPPTRRGDEALVAAGERMAARVGGYGFLRQLAAQETRPDSLERLAGTTVPVLVVSGTEDDVCPPALQRELADHCPTATLEALEGAGHMLPLEDPAGLAGVVRAWWRLPGGPTASGAPTRAVSTPRA